MNLMKFSIPLTLYRLEPSTLANVTGDAIRRFAFRSIDNTPDEKVYGFVPEDDMFADLETSILEKGQYMSFGFRIDTGKIPSEMTRAPPRGKARRSFPDPERRNSKTFASPGSFQKQNTAPL